MGCGQHLALDIVYEATRSCMTSCVAPSMLVAIFEIGRVSKGGVGDDETASRMYDCFAIEP